MSTPNSSPSMVSSLPAPVPGSTLRRWWCAVRPLPLNVMLVPDLPANDRLQALGVRRLSGGSAIAQAAAALVGRLADDLLAGRGEALFAESAGYGEINALFSPRESR